VRSLNAPNTIGNRKLEKVNTVVQLKKIMFGTIRMKGTGLSFFKNNKNTTKITEREKDGNNQRRENDTQLIRV